MKKNLYSKLKTPIRTKVKALNITNTSRASYNPQLKVRVLSINRENHSKSLLKFTPSTTFTSSLYSEDSSLSPPKLSMTMRNSIRPANPDDFIEPLTNLSIPSTEEFLKHKRLSEPIPEIIDCFKSRNLSNSELNNHSSCLKRIAKPMHVPALNFSHSKSLSSVRNTINLLSRVLKSPSKKIIRKLK